MKMLCAPDILFTFTSLELDLLSNLQYAQQPRVVFCVMFSDVKTTHPASPTLKSRQERTRIARLAAPPAADPIVRARHAFFPASVAARDVRRPSGGSSREPAERVEPRRARPSMYPPCWL